MCAAEKEKLSLYIYIHTEAVTLSVMSSSAAAEVVTPLSSQNSLLLDDSIRIWVLLPITVAMFLVGVLRHLGTKLLSSKPAPPTDTAKAQMREAQAVVRSQVCIYLCTHVFMWLRLLLFDILMRNHDSVCSDRNMI